MIFRPDINPPMWGPLSAVQYAVKDNCQKREIPYPRFYIPMWENGGHEAYDIINGIAGTFVNPDVTWANPGLKNEVAGGEHWVIFPAECLPRITTSAVDQVSSYGTMLVVANPPNTPNSPRVLIGAGTPTTSSERYWSISTNATSSGPIAASANNQTAAAIKSGGSNTGATSSVMSNDGKYNLYGTCLYESAGARRIGLFNQNGLRNSATASSYIVYADNMSLYLGGWRTSGASTCDMKFAIGWDNNIVAPNSVSFFYDEPYALLMPVSRPVYFDLGVGGSTLYSAIFDSLCRSSLLTSRLADSRADAGLVTTITHDTAASVAEDRTSLHDSRLSAASLETLPIDTAAAVSTEALATVDSRAVVSAETSRVGDSRAEVSVLDSRSHDARANVSALTARLTDTAVAVTELVNEIRWFDTRVKVSDLASRLVDTRAVAAREEARWIDSAAKVSALESRLIDTGTAVAGLLDEIRRFDTRVAACVLEVAEVDLRAAVSLAEERAVDALAAVAECVTALHDARLGAAELEARVWDTLANTGEILQALGPIFSPGLHSITVQRAILSVTPVRGLRRFDGH